MFPDCDRPDIRQHESLPTVNVTPSSAQRLLSSEHRSSQVSSGGKLDLEAGPGTNGSRGEV